MTISVSGQQMQVLYIIPEEFEVLLPFPMPWHNWTTGKGIWSAKSRAPAIAKCYFYKRLL